jgi:glutathione synthase/RimK-type ligase-like ATP-grasp enzyme
MERNMITNEGPMPRPGVTIYWFWPQRQRRPADPGYVDAYISAASAAGMAFEYVAPEDFVLVNHGSTTRVFVKGREISAAESVFHNKLYTWPQFAADIWPSLALYQGLELAGFHTIFSHSINVTSNDKLATLQIFADVAGPIIPTLRMPTRELGELDVSPEDLGFDYPVVVKPGNWGSGKGVTRADHEGQLVSALWLASAAELTMVVQPVVADPEGRCIDVRVMCADGEPIAAVERSSKGDRVSGNYAAGGTLTLIEPPGALLERTRRVSVALELPWLAVDYLYDGHTYYLSEIETAAQVPNLAEWQPIQLQRFRAYRRSFDRWAADHTPKNGGR